MLENQSSYEYELLTVEKRIWNDEDYFYEVLTEIKVDENTKYRINNIEGEITFDTMKSHLKTVIIEIPI